MTLRIPFQASIRTAIVPPPTCTHSAIFWFIIRGVEALPITLGGGALTLPAATRLVSQRQANVTVAPEEMITIAQSPPG
jgi:hypothetical protein